MIAKLSQITTPNGLVERVELDTINSTNEYAMALIRSQPAFTETIVVTKNQTEGKGQRSKSWSSEPGLDLCMSWVRKSPDNVPATVFNMAAALGVLDGIRYAVKTQIPSASLCIKWPNDILLLHDGDFLKLSGLLIENHWRGEKWTNTIVGVGVNINSLQANKYYRAISLIEALKSTPLLNLTPQDLELPILEGLQNRSTSLTLPHGLEKTVQNFNSELFSLGIPRCYTINEVDTTGTLIRVEKNGMATFKWSDPQIKSQLHSSEVIWHL